jgi:integrase
MSTVKALIRKNKVNSQGTCTIYLRYGHRQKSIDFSTGIKIKPNTWSENKETINSIASINKNKTNEELIIKLKRNDLLANAKISNLKAEVMEIARNLELQKIDPVVEMVKSEFQKTNEVESADLGEEKLLKLYREFIDKTNKSDGTKEKYTNAVYHLDLFEKKRKISISIKDVTLSLFDDVIKFLFQEIKRHDNSIGLADNTVGTTIKNIKVFLSYLIKRGYPIPNMLSELKVPKSDTPIFFLTEEELKTLENHQFKEDRLGKVRDVFIFNCYTGLRFSDLERLNKEHITDGVLQMRAFKNQKDIYVPITSIPERILIKYDYELPIISEQKFNQYIKEACKAAEINSRVEIIKTSSGNKTYEHVPKWQVITSHIAIKTFISLCGKKGISPKIVSEITGKSVQIILKHYYGIDKPTIKSQMLKAFD